MDTWRYMEMKIGPVGIDSQSLSLVRSYCVYKNIFIFYHSENKISRRNLGELFQVNK